MLNFKKVFILSAIILLFITLSSSAHEDRSIYPSLLRPYLAEDKGNRDGTKRIVKTLDVLGSNSDTTRRRFIRRSTKAAALPLILSTFTVPMVQAITPTSIQMKIGSVGAIQTKEDFSILYMEMGYPEKIAGAIADEMIKLCNSKEIKEFLKNINIQQLISDAQQGNIEGLSEFFQDLRNILRKKGYGSVSDIKNIKPIIRYLAYPYNGDAGEDIFTTLRKTKNITPQKKAEMMENITSCVPNSILLYSICRFFGFNDALIVATAHHMLPSISFNGGNPLFFSDFTLGIRRLVKIDSYNNQAGGKFVSGRPFVARKRLTGDRLLTLKSAFKQLERNQILFFIQEHNITNEEVLNLWYSKFSVLTDRNDRIIGVSRIDGKSFELIPIDEEKERYWLIDRGRNIKMQIDLSAQYLKYNDGESEYYSISRGIPERRLSELEDAFEEFKNSALSVFIERNKITDEELFALFYPMVYLPDIRGLAFIPYLNCAGIYIELGQLDRAWEAIEKARALNGSSEEVCIKEGLYWLSRFRNPVDGDNPTMVLNEALNAFNRACAINRSSSKVHFYLGSFYLERYECERGKTINNGPSALSDLRDKAMIEFNYAVIYGYHDTASVFSKRGRAWFYLGEYDKAEKDYIVANAIDPLNVSLRLQIAEVYYKLGNREKMLHHYIKAVDLGAQLSFVPEEDGIREEVIRQLAEKGIVVSSKGSSLKSASAAYLVRVRQAL
jgi:tetratricopeptide (TPR) repeat protein